MKLLILSLTLLVAFGLADDVKDGFLNVNCNESSDCYVLDNVYQGLWLACYYDEHKCKCENTIGSDYYLKWDNGECLMSKYGPCGAKGELAVGCQDGFVCADNQCRDPKDTSTGSVKVAPFIFTESKCSEGCSLDNLKLRCNFESNQCECKKLLAADAPDTYWDIRNYDGDNNCSVGKFGPCGTRNGITIDCHGEGITCISGTCLKEDHLVSDVGEECADDKNCKEGLLCSLPHVCIEPHSLAEHRRCRSDIECAEGLLCKHNPDAGPWSLSICQKSVE